MPIDFQLTVDCTDPHSLAEWWAETLGWQVEPSNEAFIKEMLAKGFATEDQTTTYRGVLVWREGAAVNSPDPGRPRMLFQTAPEAKTVKNRLHLDLRVGAEQIDEVRDALVARGATYLWSASQGPHSWHTMTDIEGNEFCVS